MKNKRTRNVLLIGAGAVVLIVIAALAGRLATHTVDVNVATAKLTSFTTKLPESGVVQRPLVATIPTLISGNLEGIYVRPGDSVSAGQLMAAVINPTLQSNAAGSQADYNSAAANITTARINEQNAKVGYEAQVQTAKSNLDETLRIYHADLNLYRNKAIARTQVDADKAKVDLAQVQYDQALRQLRLGAVTGYGQNSVQYAQAAAEKARILNQSNQQQLGFTQVTAPFSGLVQTVATQPNDPLTPLRPGDPVTAGQALFTMSSGNSYIVKAQVDEQDVINVHIGQPANITGEDFPGQTLSGHVAAIAPVAIKSTDPSSTAKQVLTTIRLDRSPSFLRDGMTVDVDILTKDIKNVLVIPTAAIQKEKSRSYVYVIRKNKAVKTYISTGTHNDTQTIVKSGLVSGDRVVAGNNPLVHNGTAVHPLPSAKASPAA